MAGFADFDAYLNAETVSQYGQDMPFTKTATWTSAAGGYYTLWNGSGTPTTGVYTGTVREATQATSSTTGALYFANATSPRKLFLTALEAVTATASATGTLVVLDRLLYYPGIDHTATTNNLTNPVALSRYTTGRGVLAFLEVTVALGATAQTVTLSSYTDQGGTGGNSTIAVSVVASSVVGRLCHSPMYLPLAAGDYGIRSVTTLTFSVANSTGTSALVLAKELARIPIGTAFVNTTKDILRSGVGIPQIADNACLMFLWIPAAAVATPVFQGNVHGCEN